MVVLEVANIVVLTCALLEALVPFFCAGVPKIFVKYLGVFLMYIAWKWTFVPRQVRFDTQKKKRTKNMMIIVSATCAKSNLIKLGLEGC